MADRDRLFVNGLRSAASKFAKAPGAISMIRNAGWEQTFRNQLLVTLERGGDVTGFTEGSTGGVSRVDLLLTCNHSPLKQDLPRPVLGVEIKINYYRQSELEVERRRARGTQQLAALEGNFPRYLVYLIAYPWGAEGDDTVRIHNLQYSKRTGYKKFSPAGERSERFSKFGDCLPADQKVCTTRVPGHGEACFADMAVWSWRIQGTGRNAEPVPVR